MTRASEQSLSACARIPQLFISGISAGPASVRENWRTTQAGMLSSPGNSVAISLGFAAALMESETTQLAPANAMQIALPDQLR
jgi:hypothetical protein